jgi:protocatechuate 3,4-dioxygenase beta subunit
MQKHHKDGVDRRTTLGALMKAGAAAFFIPAWNETIEAQTTITCVQTTPTQTEGPYWVDEKLFRSDIRADPSTGTARAGVPLTLTITVQNLSGSDCAPLMGAYVDIWHCDGKGTYSDEPTYNPGGGTGNVNTSGQKFLRGYQISDANGQVTFTTIYPELRRRGGCSEPPASVTRAYPLKYLLKCASVRCQASLALASS